METYVVLTFEIVYEMQWWTIHMKPFRQYICTRTICFQCCIKGNFGFFLNFDVWHSWELKPVRV